MDTAPMLAKAVPTVPEPDSVRGGLRYEPKWDGFRGIVTVDGDHVEIGSRGAKPLTRYFPELVETFRAQLGGREHPVVLDGEVVLRTGEPGSERLDWDALSQRIHPAESRITKLSRETPAQFIAFDLLAVDGEELLDRTFDERRERLEALATDLADPLFVTRTTLDVDTAREWFTTFEGAGLDGVVAKPRARPYEPGKRTMLKVKHHRTADVVAIGYRVHKSGRGVGSLLVGLYDADGELRQVGGVSAFSDERRVELVDELDPVVLRDADGRPVTGDGERSRFSSGRDTSFVRLTPARVLEVRYDQMEGDRFRHTVQFERWRPDRDPESCRYDQLDVPVAWDLRAVLE
ncbi:ATP-dependent DNA ligase [Curtobacterium luteum]|uniref:DNA ligase (ATP) n=1 Tax=Curtobacterium luteum TaxID=33881 RepID=A0A8H9GA87_9MICO|nr:ATP-dependent DNA ligase [Curtobacterium luteum]MBM7801138.1 ATP-dependent DNA ligase [Curtobacterium luteum]NUU52505.1 ATP-dependent DNA ligase [Curtobacterium luteum]GGK96529.1 DNA ligase C [Curtobacterium luteum]